MSDYALGCAIATCVSMQVMSSNVCPCSVFTLNCLPATCYVRSLVNTMWTDSNASGAYGRDALNDNGERLMAHATENTLALLNMYYATPGRGISYTFRSLDQGKAQYRLDYILTRHVDNDWCVMSLCGPHPARMLSRTTAS